MKNCKSVDLNNTVLLDEPADTQNCARHPYLVIYIGKNSGSQHRLKQGIMTVGRSSRADITINDDRISRIHCIIEWIGDTIEVEDSGSTNGTFVDSQRVNRVLLSPGTPLQLGQSIMKIDYKSEAEVRTQEKLLNRASIDSLTGIYNRQHFFNLSSMEIAYSLRHNLPVGMIMIDIDDFKRINHKYGHQAGDFILAQFANVIQENNRVEDVVARYGGEEFIIFPHGEVSEDVLHLHCERIRNDIENYQFRCDEIGIQLTASLGFFLMKAEINDAETILYELIRKADQALHLAKEKGKNCTQSLV
jgi:diguanylate cyclase (GGDEF)-like protein